MNLQLQFAQASFWWLEQLLLCEVYSHMFQRELVNLVYLRILGEIEYSVLEK